MSGKTLRELADQPFARGVYLRKITRNMLEIPILPETEVLRGDVLSVTGSPRNVERAVTALGFADRPLESTDIMTVAGGILLGGLIGALSFQWGRFPISLSTSGGVLMAGLVLGYLRAVRPTFGRIPAPALVLMNTLGLNVFIAVVGINAGPGFLAGLQQVGLSLFLWGMVATSVPLDRRGAARPLRLQVPSGHSLRRLRRCTDDDRRPGDDSGSRQEQGSGARLRHALRHRQHAAHDLRHGRRAVHEQVDPSEGIGGRGPR